jgi:hypothetical protein
MSTKKQVEANRRNARRSTGPRTADGKARVASNALTHGLTGKQIILRNENPRDFEAFRISLLDDLNLKGALQEVLGERIVIDLWRLRRVPVLEATLYKSSAGADRDPSLVPIWSLENSAETFATLWRHEAALHRSFLRSLYELQRLQAMRAGEWVPAPTVVDVNVNTGRDGAPNPEPILRNELPSPEPVSAEVESDVTPIEDKRAQVSFFITNSQKAELRDRGYSEDEIAKMKPAEAHRILGLA